MVNWKIRLLAFMVSSSVTVLWILTFNPTAVWAVVIGITLGALGQAIAESLSN